MIGITWKDCYATHVGCFDSEHQHLVALIDQYFRAIRENRGEQVVDSLLEKILDYTASHFAHEEKMMREHTYPRYHAHRQEHLKMIASVKGFQALLADDGTDRGDILMTIRNFLRDWLLHHIVEEDQKYGPFFNQKGIC